MYQHNLSCVKSRMAFTRGDGVLFHWAPRSVSRGPNGRCGQFSVAVHLPLQTDASKRNAASDSPKPPSAAFVTATRFNRSRPLGWGSAPAEGAGRSVRLTAQTRALHIATVS